MENSTIIYAVTFVSFVVMTTGLALAIWKIYRYRKRVHASIDNERWEQTLSREKIYKDNLIVFFGDSQIGLWRMAPSFGLLPIVNKGVYGEFASKAFDRFQQDVLSLNPRLLVMLIGINDLGSGQSVEAIVKNIQIMADMASNRDVSLILCSLLPVRGKYIHNHSLKDIVQINTKLKILSDQYDADYVDFHSQLIDNHGLFKSEFTFDGLHPSEAGYVKMTNIIFPYLVR
ncbi:GDSL-type esterase/lipase family protein [Desulfopila sp. IMCC35008]|uniref:GDSL-type esterase/lipase family protein n=1 Tax=Desulfopila sp. IMCC35008 TaxID=2653858 RepID=UPI0013D06E25|nr:GDSL-type esterase/lipase family protein [Desulfopila sp. IMCC35008]